MTDHGRAALALLLLVATALSLARAWRPRGELSAPGPAQKCEIPVEELDGIHCLSPEQASARGLHPGDVLAADGTKSRVAPARVELFQLPIDLDHASAEELASLPGLGPAMAQKIVAARPFPSVSALRELPGVGPKSWARWKDRLYLGDRSQ